MGAARPAVSSGLAPRISRPVTARLPARSVLVRSSARHDPQPGRRSVLAGFGLMSWIWTSKALGQSTAETLQESPGEAFEEELQEFGEGLEEFGEELGEFGESVAQAVSEPEVRDDLLAVGGVLTAVGLGYTVNLQNTLEEVRAELEATDEALKASRDDAARTRDELDAALDDLRERRAEIDDLGRVLEDERATAEAGRREAEARERGLGERLKEVMADGEAVRGELRAVGEELARRTETLRRVEEGLGEAERDLAAAQESLGEERGRVATLEKARDAAVKDVRTTLAQLRDLDFSLSEEKERTAQLSHDADALKARVLELEETLVSTEALAASKSADLSKLNTDMQKLQNTYGEALDRERALQEELLAMQEEARDEQAKARRALKIEQASVARLKEEVEKKATDIKNAIEVSTRLQSQLMSAEATAGRLATVEEQLGLVTQEAQAVQEKLKVAEKDSKALRTARAKLIEAEENLKAVQKEIVVTQNAGKAELRQVKMELAGAQRETQNLRRKLSDAEAQALLLNEELLSARSELERQKLELAKVDVGPAASNGGGNGGGVSGKSQQDVSLVTTGSPAAPSTPRQELEGQLAGSLQQETDTEQHMRNVQAIAKRSIAQVRAEAALLVEAIEDRAYDAVAEADQKAQAAQKAANSHKQKAEAAQERAQRLQDSLDRAYAQLQKEEQNAAVKGSHLELLETQAKEAQAEVDRLKKMLENVER